MADSRVQHVDVAKWIQHGKSVDAALATAVDQATAIDPRAVGINKNKCLFRNSKSIVPSLPSYH